VAIAEIYNSEEVQKQLNAILKKNGFKAPIIFVQMRGRLTLILNNMLKA
jgi:hypothetical protein